MLFFLFLDPRATKIIILKQTFYIKNNKFYLIGIFIKFKLKTKIDSRKYLNMYKFFDVYYASSNTIQKCSV
jgi:hypothetical protein